MSGLLQNFRNTILLSIAIALLFVVGYGFHSPTSPDHRFWLDMRFWEAAFRRDLAEGGDL